MKLIWAKDRKHVILKAETRAEVAFCDIVAGDLNGHKYKYSLEKAEYMIEPIEGDIEL